MAARNSNPRKSGSSDLLVKIVPLLIVLLLLGGGAYYYFFMRGPQQGPGVTAPAQAPAAVAPVTPGTTPAAAPVAAAAPPIDQLSVDQLFKESSNALKEQRLVAPAGNNALEFYLKILEKEPKNNAAKDALRELFPFATGAVETNINGGQLDDATRVIEMLSRADPSNYTLTILRSKLEVKKKQVDREQAVAAAAAARATAAPTATAPAADAGTGEGAVTPTTPASTRPASATTASTAAPAPATPLPAPTPPPVAPVVAPAPTGESRDAEVVKTVPPEYPRDAARKRQEGWVEVEFTITAEGQVTDARVVGSDPPRVFDREAVRAVERWTFRPKVENGQPQSTRMKRRIEFKYNG